MNRLLHVLVLCITPLLVGADVFEENAVTVDQTPLLVSGDVFEENSTTGDQAPLLGKSIVRSVQRDGIPTPAQIGREVGDIITIKKAGNQLALS